MPAARTFDTYQGRNEDRVRAREHLVDARILVVDDEKANILLLERTLQKAGYRSVRSTTDPRAVIGLVTEFRPDLLLLDLKMPQLDGFEILEQLGAGAVRDPDLPVLVLTADATRDAKRRALAAGARDFLTKPLDLTEVIARAENLLEIRFLRLRLEEQDDALRILRELAQGSTTVTSEDQG